MADALQPILDYHERTTHRPGRYAASLGYLDWDTQPNPFRLYDGAEWVALPRSGVSADSPGRDVPADSPTWADLHAGAVVPAALDLDLLGSLLYHALALSAWKQAGSSRWSLRVNPSSGNLHPTEAYLLAGPIAGLSARPGLYHYTPLLHALERRGELEPGAWDALAFPGLLVGLSSIAWREAWKYGERAFRYCNHDIGHAIAAIDVAAALHGWRAVLIDPLADDALARLLGLAGHGEGVEAERPDCLLALVPRDSPLALDPELLAGLVPTTLHGAPNQLSTGHHHWEILDEIAAATTVADDTPPRPLPPPALARPCDLAVAAGPLVRRRRSAVAMDGRTGISSTAFYDMLLRTCPGGLALAALPWRPTVDLALMVHRVAGLAPGLYLQVRHPSREDRWQRAVPHALWEPAPDCPEALRLWCLAEGDVRRSAAFVSCGQDIAADGAFSLGMVVDLRAELEREGPAHYRRLYWETGAIGQLLYLEAEALGIAATGIGCFFDQPVRDLFGFADDPSLRSLYHFTVGGRVDDPRLRTLGAYYHLDRRPA